MSVFIFFFNDTATTEIYTLSLHDALPIYPHPLRARSRPQPAVADRPGDPVDRRPARHPDRPRPAVPGRPGGRVPRPPAPRSEEHTSELQSRQYLVCRLLLEKKKKRKVPIQ